MKQRLLIVLAVLVLFAPAAFADGLVVTGGDSTWHTWTDSQVNMNGSPFWDVKSQDGDGACNIGYWLGNVSGCATTKYPNLATFYSASPNINPASLGSGSTEFKLTSDGTTSMVSGLLSVTAWSDTFGFCLANSWNGSAYTQCTALYNNTTSTLGSAATYLAAGDYVLYVTAGAYDGQTRTFYSTTLDGSGRSHFAVFQVDPTHYYIGIEDNDGTTHKKDSTQLLPADYDYNDVVLELTLGSVPKVPEPATMALLGTGLVGLAGVIRKRRTR